MSRTPSHPNFLQADLIIRELMCCGAQMFFVAPGSRSSPLAMAVGRLAPENAIVHFDERGLAFAAIGYAHATRTPAVLICTSGTAVANFLPAVVEASMSAIPLLILTADRPPELQDRGANQTIPQRGIFGAFVRFECELETPSSDMRPDAIVQTIVAAMQFANGKPPGPVHVNCPYREPLVPVNEEHSFAENLDELRGSSNQISQVVLPEPDSSPIGWLSKRLKEACSGLIVVGRLDSLTEADAVANFANATGWPVVADVTSQLRLTRQCPQLCEHFDLLLLNEKIAASIQPEMVMHVGGELVSKRLLEHFERHRPAEYVHISNDPRRRDPSGCVTNKITIDLSLLPRSIEVPSHLDRSDTLIAGKNRQISDFIATRFGREEKLSEIGVARAVVANAPANSAFFLASSLPIRLVDMYAPVVESAIHVGSNRGASGIDGTIASAIGFARGTGLPTTLLIGDLAFLHDLNSLAMVREARGPFIIVLINNNGGGIFHLLPISERNPQFEKFWGTPHGLSFGGIAKTFGLAYHSPKNMTAFKDIFAYALASSTPVLIEVFTSREETAELIRQTQSEIRSL